MMYIFVDGKRTVDYPNIVKSIRYHQACSYHDGETRHSPEDLSTAPSASSSPQKSSLAPTPTSASTATIICTPPPLSPITPYSITSISSWRNALPQMAAAASSYPSVYLFPEGTYFTARNLESSQLCMYK